ncbi:MAG: YdcF family protein [Acidimicrobiaceae bacterium]|nr:YdcF family protein [Acidimicrobiaceae bacterium]
MTEPGGENPTPPSGTPAVEPTPPSGTPAVEPVMRTEADVTPVNPQRPLQPGRRSPWRRVRRVGYVLVALLAVYYLAMLWWVHTVGTSDQARPVDAIVVMGAAQYDGRPSAQLAARLDHVVDLWDRGLAPMVVTTGGNRPGDRFTEAQASAAYLVEQGVPESAIVEVGGATSFGSLELVRDQIRIRGLQSILLVSDPYHSLRIRLSAQELGLTAYVSPTRTSPVTGWTALWREMKEAAGVAIGWLIGFRRLLRLTG